jgi:hypothetical protein
MRMGALLVTLATLASLAAALAQTYSHYDCADGANFEVAFYPETKAAYVQVDGKSFMLPKRFSLTSQRFTQSGISLSMKNGGKATLKHYGKTSQCQAR